MIASTAWPNSAAPVTATVGTLTGPPLLPDCQNLQLHPPGTPSCAVHHRFARINGVRLHYVEAFAAESNGPESPSGKLCLALHGFPEFWYSWRHQVPALTAAGFRVIAPDLRGYNLSDKPSGVLAYRLQELLGDVLGLIDHAGEERASILGHDWGGAIAWRLAMRHPRAVEKLIILNAPHPAAYLRELRSGRQLLKSWYVFFFQVPGLPELLLGLGDFDWLARTLQSQPVHREAFGPDDVRRYKQALARPGALTAALNYYRALRDSSQRSPRDIRTIHVPVLLVWGERDMYLSVRLTEGLGPWVPNLRLVRLPDASHWVQNDAPQRVNRLMVDFLKEDPRMMMESNDHAGNG